MVTMLKNFFLALIIYSCVELYQAHTAKRSSSSSSSSAGAGIANQTCYNMSTDQHGFYCPADGMCKEPREERCIGSDVCPQETGCQETATEGQYRVKLGRAKLGILWFKRGFLDYFNLELEHQFVTYRGFTYEFGKSYGVQVLDISDPKYKYRNGKDVKRINTAGESYCTYQDAQQLVNSWKSKKYSLLSTNCQHFADAMIEILTRTSCNQPPSTRSKRQNSEENFALEIHQILTNCSIVCCDDSSAAPTSTTNIWIPFFAILTYHASLVI